MSLIKTPKVGLAAFIQLDGVELVDYKNSNYIFESDISIQQWQIKYLNSCCHAHDTKVCELRKFKKK